jgi:peptidoglycan biosynthesis protein MviN/MurJ (putative lipid II flippase)
VALSPLSASLLPGPAPIAWVSGSGTLWAITRLMSLLAIAAFCVATWALFARHDSWEAAAIGSAALGVATLLAYWLAAHSGGETAGTASWNASVHVPMTLGVFMLLLVPQLEHRGDHQVMTR